MEFSAWLSLALVCTIGAMSPGPSLAVVFKNTLLGGRIEGIKTAIAHGIGVGIYALGTAFGLAVILKQSPMIFEIIRWAGAAFLLYIGIRSLLSNGNPAFKLDENTAEKTVNSIQTGFLIAFLNPKLAIFFAALFSQFVSAEAQLGEKIIMATTALTIDTLWYLFIAMAISHKAWINKLQEKSIIIDRILGVLLVGLAVRVVTI